MEPPSKLSFFKDLAQRRIFRYLVAYAAAGWATLEVVDQFADNGVVPRVLYRGALSLFVSGLPGALIVSWFHGAKGRQEVPAIERWLLGAVAIFALITTGFVVRAGLADPAGASAAVLAPEADPSRVAVMYFEPRGGGDAEFLAAGLTEALIDELSAVEGLHTVSKNGSQLFRGRSAPVDSIGRTLQAGTIVSGIVAQAGDRVRVDVSAANAVSGDQYDSKRLERPRAEIFDLQDELADTVAVFLRRAIGVELSQVQLRAGTESVAAWEFVQRAQQAADGSQVILASNDIEGASRALAGADSVLAQAEAADPAWVEPIVRRAWLAYRQARLGGVDRTHSAGWSDVGIAHAERALALRGDDPGALEIHATLVYWKVLLNLAGSPAERDRLREKAEAEFRAAIAGGGQRAFALTSLSHIMLNKGLWAEAKLNGLRAYEADPFLENVNLTLFRIFTASWNLQDAVEAKRYCDEGVRRFPNDFRFRQCELWSYSLPGVTPDFDRAWQLAAEFGEMSPPPLREVNRLRGYTYVGMALALAATGQPSRPQLADSARAVLVRGRATAQIDPGREIALLESIARTTLGDIQEAVLQLSNYLAANPGQLDAYRADAQRNELPWYHRALIDEARFRELVGLR